MTKNLIKKILGKITRKYLNSKGILCPFCDSNDISPGCCEHEDELIIQEVECMSCGAFWQDIFRLSSISIDADLIKERFHDELK